MSKKDDARPNKSKKVYTLEEVSCKYCGKEYGTPMAKGGHERFCKKNPEIIERDTIKELGDQSEIEEKLIELEIEKLEKSGLSQRDKDEIWLKNYMVGLDLSTFKLEPSDAEKLADIHVRFFGKIRPNTSCIYQMVHCVTTLYYNNQRRN